MLSHFYHGLSIFYQLHKFILKRTPLVKFWTSPMDFYINSIFISCIHKVWFITKLFLTVLIRMVFTKVSRTKVIPDLSSFPNRNCHSIFNIKTFHPMQTFKLVQLAVRMQLFRFLFSSFPDRFVIVLNKKRTMQWKTCFKDATTLFCIWNLFYSETAIEFRGIIVEISDCDINL